MTSDAPEFPMATETNPYRTVAPLEWRPKQKRTVSQPQKSVKTNKWGFDMEEMIAELKDELQTERDNEERLMLEISNELNNFGHSEKHWIRFFDQTVARLANRTEGIEQSAEQLAGNLQNVSVLAESISSRVAALDVAKGRVVECLQRVNDLRDLRTCSEGVEKAIRSEEYEEAAQYIHRFNTLEDVVFKMGAQTDAQDFSQSMKSSYDTLRAASAKLKAIIEDKFDKAVSTGDVASMERFFKLFPLLNEHSSGLKRFGAYLCGKIEKSCDDFYKIMQAGGTDDSRKNVLYSDTITMILEEIASVVMEYQPLIDNFFGPDKLLDLMEIIQIECDKQVSRVIDAFIQNRQFDQRNRSIREFLRGTTGVERLDPIALDILLSEVTLIHTRAELYWRFLKRRLGEAPARPLSESDSPHSPKALNFSESAIDDNDDELTDEQRVAMIERLKKAKTERAQKLDTVLNRSKLGMRMQELLGQYVMMEQYYMQESVSKALEMEDMEDGALTSSILDDVFFIVRKCIRRSITSSSVDCVCAMINNGMTLLETGYLDRLNAVIMAGYPSTGWAAEAYQHAQTAYNVLQHGKSVAEAGPETQKRAFIAALNNIRASVQCVVTLKDGLSADFDTHLKQISQTEKGKLEHSLFQFEELGKKFEQMSSSAINKLCAAAFRQKLKTNAEVYLDFEHDLTDEQLHEYECIDPFMENFVNELDGQVHKFEKILLPENYDELLEAVSSEAVHQVERVVFKCGFNHLGGLQLDKEYRTLASYLTTIAGWKVREKCAKLSQIVNLLSTDSIDEAVNFYKQLQNTAGGVLAMNEFKKVLALRLDFPKDKIKNISL